MPGQTPTPRERAVLAAIERRLTNSEIASELFISVRTVESHIASLRRKLGAESRAELMAAAGERREREASVRVPPNAFLGRAADLDRLAAAVDRHHCVTITGPGGVGKTRLALEFARTGERIPVVVELEHAGPGDIVARIARVLDLEAAPGADAAASVALALASQPYLLVLDNIDRVGGAVRDVVSRVIAAAPELRVVTTSRTPIGDPAEHVFPLSPLGIEGSDAAAVAMFLDRLDASGSRPPTREERELAAQVCQRLDGLPLAIELAAAVARHLSMAELAERLDRDFAALDRAAPEGRHRTLETAFEWTWDLLTDEEREVLCRLGALPRTFDVELATTVTRPGAEGVLLRLLDHSLIVPAGGTPRRFRLLAVMREFVHARTDPAVIREVLAEHAAFFARVAHEFACRARTDDSLEAMQESQRLCSEVNAALRWSLAARHPSAVTLAACLSVGVEQYGSDLDTVRTLAMAAQDERVLAEATTEQLLLLGNGLSFLDMQLVDRLAELAAERADATGDDRSRLAARHLAGMADAYGRRGERALENLAEAERLARQLGDEWELAAVHQMRGIALRTLDLAGPARAIAEFEAAMDAYARAGDAMHVNNARYMMALTAAEAGIESERAAQWAAECAEYARAAQNRHELAHAHLVLQMLATDAAPAPDGTTDPADLATDFRALGDMRCLTRTLVLRARRTADARERVTLLTEALGFAETGGDRSRQASILAMLAEAHEALGDGIRARTALGRLESLTERAGVHLVAAG